MKPQPISSTDLSHNHWPSMKPLYPVLLLFGLAFSLQVYRLSAQSLWMDETITVARSNLSLPLLIRELQAIRNHTPLYFLLMHGWQRLGHVEWMVRFPSAFWAMLGLSVTYRLARETGRQRAALLATLLLAASPLYIWYAQDARMYTMAAFWVTASALFLIRAWRSGRWQEWVGYAVCVLVASLTHLLTTLVFLNQALYLILQLRKEPPKLRSWAFAMTAPAIVFLAWLKPMLLTGGFAPATPWIAWIPRPALWDLPLTLYTFTVSATAGRHSLVTCIPLLIAGSALGALIWQRGSFPKLARWRLSLLAWQVMGTICLTFLISQVRPIYMDRYFVPLLPVFLVLVACGLARVLLWWKRAAIAALGIFILFDAASLRNMYFDSRYHRDDWRGTAALINGRAQSGDGLISYVALPFHYYALNLTRHTISSQTADPAYFAHQTAEATAGKARLWVIIPLTVLNNHSFFDERDAVAIKWVENNPYVLWLTERYPLIEAQRLPGVQVMLYNVRPDGTEP